MRDIEWLARFKEVWRVRERATVPFALNDRPGVGPATRARILQAANDLDWRPSVPARALSRSRALSLGLVMLRGPELIGTDPFFPSSWRGSR